MRPLEKVIQATIKLIPADVECREAIVHDLNKVIESIPYTAPEAIGVRWEQFVEILSYSIGAPDKGWKRDISDLVAGVTDYKQILNG